MARPSTHTDRLLIKTARRLYPRSGCKRLNLREVARESGVNLGMFHYHFKTKDEFVKRVFQDFYEEFFKNFDLEAVSGRTSVEKLRSVLIKISFFVRDNREFMSAMMMDLMNGEPLAVQFAKRNFARHINIMMNLIGEGQTAGAIEPLPVAQIIFILLSGIIFPILAASRVQMTKQAPKKMKATIDMILTEQAMVNRIDMVLKGVSASKRKSS